MNASRGLWITVVVVLVSTVFCHVPTSADSGWTIAYPLPGDQVAVSGGLSCGGTAPGDGLGYFLEVVQNGKSVTTPVQTSPEQSYGSFWSNVVGANGSFSTGAATLKVWADSTKSGDPLVSVDFTFANI